MSRKLLAEFLGSLLLAALVIGSGIAAQRLSTDGGLRLLENAAATAAGAALAVVVLRALYPLTTPAQAADVVLPHPDYDTSG